MEVASTSMMYRYVARSPSALNDRKKDIIFLANKINTGCLTCPVCNGLFQDPYVATCGVSGYL